MNIAIAGYVLIALAAIIMASNVYRWLTKDSSFVFVLPECLAAFGAWLAFGRPYAGIFLISALILNFGLSFALGRIGKKK